MKSTLKRLGFFTGLRYGMPEDPPVFDNRGTDVPKDMWKQVQYLESGKAIVATPGLSRDVFHEEVVIGPLHILTDGTYAWPSDYPYYVEKYNVRVPDEVVAHMARRAWTIAPFDLAACEL